MQVRGGVNETKEVRALDLCGHVIEADQVIRNMGVT